MSNKKELGNPLVAATAAKVVSDNSPTLLRGARNLSVLLVVAGGSYLGYKALKNRRINNLKQKAGTNPEVQAAMDLYNTIPAGLKKGKGGFFNPGGFISDAANKVSLIWKRTDTDRILGVAKRIHNQKLDLDKVYKYFYTIYRQQLYTLINVALSPEELARFNNYARSGSVSNTANVKASKFAVTKVNNLNVRKTPVNMSWKQVFKTSNKIGTVPIKKMVGMTTGKEFYDKENDVVFVELHVWDKNNQKHTAYAWKGGLEFMDYKGLANRFNVSDYGQVMISKTMRHLFDTDEFNGLSGYAPQYLTDQDLI